MSEYVRSARTNSSVRVDISAADAGWEWTALKVIDLVAGESITIDMPECEFLVLPLHGSAEVTVGAEHFILIGRPNVFAGASDFVYIGRDDHAIINATADARIAFPASRARHHLPARYQPSSAVPVELRGAGNCSRQVNNFCTPESFEADRLIACEVITPSGNWSSYPPHKHDEERDGETPLEEIYYFEIADGPSGEGFGYQRVYGTADRPIDVLAEVRTGDTVLIPHGWHGPAIAAPGYDMYYLNVMAGPGAERAWRICDDPAHAWVRQTWSSQEIDPRLPFRA